MCDLINIINESQNKDLTKTKKNDIIWIYPTTRYTRGTQNETTIFSWN